MEARATIAAAATQVSDLSTALLLFSRPSSALVASAAGLLSVAALAPPRRAVRSETPRAAPQAFVRQIRRTRRRSLPGDGDGDEEALYGGDGDDGAFGGGGGGGGGCGGGRWGDFEGWEESGSSPSSCDPAFDFVCGVISCAALYSCTQFAFNRVCRFMAAKEKMVPSPLIIPRIAG